MKRQSLENFLSSMAHSGREQANPDYDWVEGNLC